MSATAIITARLQSFRLPRKVILPFGRSTIIETIIERLRRSKQIDEIIIASPADGKQTEIQRIAACHEVMWFEGAEEDVVHRLAQVAAVAKNEKILVVTGDLPFISYEGLDAMVAGLNSDHEYGNNVDSACPYLDGTNAEIITKKGAVRQDAECTDPKYRKMACCWIRTIEWQRKQLFDAPYSTMDLSYVMVDSWADYFMAEFIESKLRGDRTYDGLIWVMRKYKTDIENIQLRYG